MDILTFYLLKNALKVFPLRLQHLVSCYIFTPGGTSKISEGPASIISLVIDDRRWAFEDVKFLIRKGHDVNKYDQNNSSSNRCRGSPFYVALRSHRYDIAKLLLLNGAKPLPTNPNYLHYFIYFRREAFYLYIASSLVNSSSG
jgi:hypothetical protein